MLDHAIVIGGSVGGLCAAAALTEVARSVTLLERDPDPRGAAPRKGTPQSHHAHVLLNLGARSLATLFPDVLEDLRRRGAICGDASGSFRWFFHGRWRLRFDKGLELRMQTRPMLEACLREHLQARAGLSLRFGAPIDEPLYDPAAGKVRGVRLVGGEELAADLVVDATGRGSRSPQWLERWGYAPPDEQTVEVGLAYVSGLFEIPASVMPSDGLMVNASPPDHRRGGVIFRVEGDRYVVTLLGYHGDHAPTDPAAFCAWAKQLVTPELGEVLAAARPLGPLHKITYPRQVRHLYEKLPRLPGAYVVHGDAVCSFDPVYGQGMTVAAAQAVALRDVIERHGPDPRRIQAAYGRIIDYPWQVTSTEAHLWSQARGYKPTGARLLQRFTARLHAAAAQDPEIHSAFLDVAHLDKRPSSLFQPRMLWKILRGPGRTSPP